jgi:hypothetical protein
MEEWREKVDRAFLRELNRRRVAKGHQRIRGPGRPRPMTGYVRYVYEYTYSTGSIEQGSSFSMRVRDEYPRTEEEDYQTYFKATAGRASSQWGALSDAEKAVRAVILR